MCNVVCNSQTVFSSHLAGKKHAAMVKKKAEAEVAIRNPKLISKRNSEFQEAVIGPLVATSASACFLTIVACF